MAFSILRFLGLKRPATDNGKPVRDAQSPHSDADPIGGDLDEAIGGDGDGDGNGDGE